MVTPHWRAYSGSIGGGAGDKEGLMALDSNRQAARYTFLGEYKSLACVLTQRDHLFTDYAC